MIAVHRQPPSVPPRASRRRGPAPRQRGSALLIVLIVLVLAASSMGLDRLERWAVGRRGREAQTARALAEAKSALLGWAATYADQHRTGPGPGYLPCPDIDDDGSPDTACPRHAFGRLPWRHLGLPDIRDASGERLWYGLSDRFRNNPVKFTPMNSETRGQLTLDGVAGIIAVLVAPGASLSGQARDTEPNRAASYLEGANATPGDGVFTNAGGGEFNDRVAGITRAELMAVVEARVLQQVARTLADYREADWNPERAPPWLSPWPEPGAATDFSGRVAVREGRLPVHRPGAVFDTGFSIRWSDLSGVEVTASGSVGAAALRAGSIVIPAGAGACAWTEAREIDCTGAASSAGGDGAIRRFTVAVRFRGDRPVIITPPAADAPRRRAVFLNGPITGDGLLEIAAVDTAPATSGSAPAAVTGRGRMQGGPASAGRIAVTGVRYDLDVPLELPRWFVTNQWRRLVYVAFAAPYQPGGDGGCTPGVDCDCAARPSCLSLRERTVTRSSIPALAVIAGPDLPGQPRASGGLAAYFEGDNRSPFDRGFERRGRSARFNDQVRILFRRE